MSVQAPALDARAPSLTSTLFPLEATLLDTLPDTAARELDA